ncbi:MAG: LysR family transcriptional regulator [Pseudomonadota bacterium]
MSRARLEDLDLNLILTLHWLLTEQSVTRAAARLEVSQPTVSHALGRLRTLLGDPLLIKSGRTMLPTKKAEALQPRVAEAIDRMRDVLLAEDSFDPASQPGRFRVAASDGIGLVVMKAWQKAVSPDAPTMELDLIQPAVPHAQDLIAGKIDAVILPEPKVLNLPPGIDIDEFVRKPLYTEYYATAVRKGHPLAHNMTLEGFVEAEHILINPEGMETGVVDEQLAAMGLQRRIAYRAETFLLALQMLQQTDCVLTGPITTLGFAHADVEMIPSPLPLGSFGLFMGWHPNWTHDPQHRWVRDRLIAEIGRLCETRVLPQQELESIAV